MRIYEHEHAAKTQPTEPYLRLQRRYRPDSGIDARGSQTAQAGNLSVLFMRADIWRRVDARRLEGVLASASG